MSKTLEAGVQVQPYGTGENSLTGEKPKKKWYAYLWDTFDKSPEERKFLTKLDAGLLTIACLGALLTERMSPRARLY